MLAKQCDLLTKAPQNITDPLAASKSFQPWKKEPGVGGGSGSNPGNGASPAGSDFASLYSPVITSTGLHQTAPTLSSVYSPYQNSWLQAAANPTSTSWWESVGGPWSLDPANTFRSTAYQPSPSASDYSNALTTPFAQPGFSLLSAGTSTQPANRPGNRRYKLKVILLTFHVNFSSYSHVQNCTNS